MREEAGKHLLFNTDLTAVVGRQPFCVTHLTQILLLKAPVTGCNKKHHVCLSYLPQLNWDSEVQGFLSAEEDLH